MRSIYIVFLLCSISLKVSALDQTSVIDTSQSKAEHKFQNELSVRTDLLQLLNSAIQKNNFGIEMSAEWRPHSSHSIQMDFNIQQLTESNYSSKDKFAALEFHFFPCPKSDPGPFIGTYVKYEMKRTLVDRLQTDSIFLHYGTNNFEAGLCIGYEGSLKGHWILNPCFYIGYTEYYNRKLYANLNAWPMWDVPGVNVQVVLGIGYRFSKKVN